MELLGRSKELGALRAILDDRRPALVRATGLRGAGKSALVRKVVVDYPGLVHVCPPLPDPDQRAFLAARLGDGPPRAPDAEGRTTTDGVPTTLGDPAGDADWPTLFAEILRRARAAARPWILVLDDAHRLAEARSRIVEPMAAVLRRAASESIALHIVLVGPDGGLPGPAETEGDPSSEGVAFERVSIGPLPFRAAASFLPGRSPDGRVRAYGVFGGIPTVLRQLDNEVTVGTNVRRLLLSSDGALADAGGAWLERDLQAPARYYSILRVLALGEADWGQVHGGVSDLTRSGQVAPYLKRLEELGLVRTRRSVDARPDGRARRYACADPFLAFWFRFVLPYRLSSSEREAGEGDHYARAVRPRMDEHLASVFPGICRQHMRYDAMETLGAAAREGGSLWGPGYDLPVAGILTNGAAYYGACRWRHDEDAPSPLAEVEAGIRETRYGFGRERRLRLVFTGRPPTTTFRREVLRNRDALLVDAEALLG